MNNNYFVFLGNSRIRRSGLNPDSSPDGHHTNIDGTVCPGSSDPFYIVTYYIKWVTISWTHSSYFRW